MNLLESLPIIQNENQCGECTACCTVLGVKQLKKDSYVACDHICASGCAIYSSRPKECETYECFWRNASAPIHLRPDKLGVVLEATETSIGPAIVVRELWVGASEDKLAEDFISLVSEMMQAFVYVVRPDKTRTAKFPPWAEHLAAKVTKIKEIGWREASLQTLQRKQQKDLEQHKRNRRKMAAKSRKRNR